MSQDISQADELVVDLTGDEMVTPFEVKPLGVRGRVVRLGPAVTELLERHGYPPAVSALLAEAAGLVALLGTPGNIRGYAHFDAEKLETLVASGDVAQRALLGQGHLVMTIDQGAEMERYQGVVAFTGESLSAAAHDYFLQSEQIPTSVRLAAGPVISQPEG